MGKGQWTMDNAKGNGRGTMESVVCHNSSDANSKAIPIAIAIGIPKAIVLEDFGQECPCHGKAGDVQQVVCWRGRLEKFEVSMM